MNGGKEEENETNIITRMDAERRIKISRCNISGGRSPGCRERRQSYLIPGYNRRNRL
jgi:hypothetical protein